MQTQYKALPQDQIDLNDSTDLIVSGLVVAVIMRDQPLTEYEKNIIKGILLKYKGTDDYKIHTLISELELLYNQGDKELESLVTTFQSLFS